MKSMRNAVVAGMVIGIGFLGNAFGQESWMVKSPIPILNNVIWAGTQFVAVGYEGAIFTSTDGIAWARKNSGTTRRLTAAAWTGSKIVVVGDSVVTTSADGITWTVVPIAGSFNAVTWAGSQLVAVGNGNNSEFTGIYTSNNGESWTRRDSTPAHAVAFGNNLVVAICGDPGKILTSSDGITWTKRDSLGYIYNELAIWTGMQFIAYSNGKTLTSTNGIAWTTNSNISIPGSIIFWTGAQFVSVSVRGSLIYTSQDAIKWTMRDAPVSNPGPNGYSPLIAIASAPSGQIVAVGIGTILSSSDGISWVSRTSAISQSLYSIVRTTNKWIAASLSTIYSSSDASAWSLTQTPVSISISPYYRTIPMVWTGTQLILACNPTTSSSTSTLFTSPDGINWKQCITNTPWLYGVTSSGNQIVAVGYQGKVLTSTDGNTWIYRNSGTYNNLYAITWTGTQFVVVGDQGEIITSSDGISWTRRYVNQINNLTSILWTGSQFVAVGYKGTIITSPDGSTWAVQNSGVSANLYGITGTATRIGVVGAETGVYGDSSGLILSSRDGISWTKRNTGTTAPLRAIAYADSQFVAVGDNGTVLVSPLSSGTTAPLSKSASPVFIPQINRQGITVDLGAGQYTLSIIDVAGRTLFTSSGTAGAAMRRTFSPAISTNCCIIKLRQNGLVRAKKLMMVN